MFQKILRWIREVLSKMFSTQNVKQALGVDIAISPLMGDALQRWSDMYEGRSPWLSADTESLNLPATIAGEIARLVTIEMQVDVTGSPRAVFLAEQMRPVLTRIRQDVEKGCAKGGLWWKPYIKGSVIAVDTVQADQGYPVSFDSSGKMTACVFSDQRKIRQYWYTRLEYHSLVGTSYNIRNAAFRSSDTSSLGQPIQLTEVEEWADIQPEATILNVTAPLFGYFRYPIANNIDTTSPLSVSCYSRAQDGSNVKLIQRADEIFSNLMWEFSSGKRLIYADELAFELGTDGKPKLPDKRLYRTLKSTGDIGGKQNKLFDEWSPEFREAAIKSGLNDTMREIEFVCGLAYGTLSDPQTVDKTATEIKISQQRSYSTVTDCQKSLQTALDSLLYAMDVWATLGGLAPRGTYAANYEFDDSVITDKELQFAQDMQLKAGGMMPGYMFLMRNRGLDEATAKKWITETQAEQPEPNDLFGDAGA